MTYETWCKNSIDIIAEAEKYNEWVNIAKANLLTRLAPRIEKLSHQGYLGCGFHYELEQRFGKLIVSMAIPWQPSANWCANVEEDRAKSIITKVIYKSLLKQVRDAEKSVVKVKVEFKRLEKEEIALDKDDE